ncbi:MAG: hypothetical protein WAM28_05300 [Chlamydiales bacterium]
MLISSNYALTATDELPEVKCKIAHWDRFERPEIDRYERISLITHYAIKVIVPLCLLLWFYTPLWSFFGLGIPTIVGLGIAHTYYKNKVIESTAKYKALRFFEVKLKNGFDVDLREDRRIDVAGRSAFLQRDRIESELSEEERNHVVTLRSDLNGRVQLLSDRMMEQELKLRNSQAHIIDSLHHLDLVDSPHLQGRLRALELAQNRSHEHQLGGIRTQIAGANRALLRGDLRSFRNQMDRAARGIDEVDRLSSNLRGRLSIPSPREEIDRVQNLFREFQAKLSNARTLHSTIPANVSILSKLTPDLRAIDRAYQDIQQSIAPGAESDSRGDLIQLWKMEERHLEHSLHILWNKLLPLEEKLNKWLEKHHPQTRLDIYKQELKMLRETVDDSRAVQSIERAWAAIERLEEQIASLCSDAQKNQVLDHFNKNYRALALRAVDWEGETSILKIASKILFSKKPVQPIHLGQCGTVEYALKSRIQQLDKHMVRLNRIQKICVEGIIMHLVSFAVLVTVSLYFPYAWLIGGFVALLAAGGLSSVYLENHLKQKDVKIRALKQALQFWSVLSTHPNLSRDLNDQLRLVDQIVKVLEEHSLFGVFLNENFIIHYAGEQASSFPILMQQMLQHVEPTVDEERHVLRKELDVLREVQRSHAAFIEESAVVNDSKRRLAKGNLSRGIFRGIKKLNEAIRNNRPISTVSVLFEDVCNHFKHLLDPENRINHPTQYPSWLTTMVEKALVVKAQGLNELSLIRFLQNIIPHLEQVESFEELRIVIEGIGHLTGESEEIERVCERIEVQEMERLASDYGIERESRIKKEKSQRLQREYPSFIAQIRERETLLNSL